MKLSSCYHIHNLLVYERTIPIDTLLQHIQISSLLPARRFTVFPACVWYLGLLLTQSKMELLYICSQLITLSSQLKLTTTNAAKVMSLELGDDTLGVGEEAERTKTGGVPFALFEILSFPHLPRSSYSRTELCNGTIQQGERHRNKWFVSRLKNSVTLMH